MSTETLIEVGTETGSQAYSCWQKTKGRFEGRTYSPYLMMVPGILTFIAMVVAIVCSVIWKCKSLCLLFTPGAAGAGYTIYLGWNYRSLKTFGENNNEFGKNNTVLGGQTTILGQQIVALKGENKELKEQIETFSSTNSQLKENLETRENQIEEFKKIIEKQELNTKEQLEQLELLKKALEELQVASKDEYEKFAYTLNKFTGEVDELNNTNAIIENNLKAPINEISSTTILLKSVLKKMRCMVDEKTLQQRYEQEKRLHNNIDTLQSKISDLQLALGVKEGMLKEQQKQLDDLKVQLENFDRVKKEYEDVLDKMVNQTNDLQLVKGDLNQETKKLKKLIIRAESSNNILNKESKNKILDKSDNIIPNESEN